MAPLGVWQVLVLEKERSLFSDTHFLAGIAVSSLAFLLVAIVPFVGSAAILFIPLPVLYYYSTTGQLKGSAILILSLAVSFAILRLLGEQVIFPVLMLLGLLGIVLAEVLKRKYPLEKAVLYSVAALVALGALFLLYTSIRSGNAPMHLIGVSITRKVQESISIYTQIDPSSEQAKLIKDNASQIIAFIINIFPAIIIVSASVIVWLNLLAARAVFTKNAIPFPDFGDLTRWKPPEKLVWIPIVAGIMILLPGKQAQLIGINMLLVSLFVYFLEGLAIVGFFFKRGNISPMLRFLFYFVIFAQQYLMVLVIAVGLFDMWIDFRRFSKTTEDSAV